MTSECTCEDAEELLRDVVLQVRVSYDSDDPDVFYVDVDVLQGVDADVLYVIAEAVLDTIRAEVGSVEAIEA